MNVEKSLGRAVITGASRGIGAGYADRLARRGYDLILVARDRGRLDELAATLRDETGRTVAVVTADLTHDEDIRRVEEIIATTDDISLVVNNAGTATVRSTIDQTDPHKLAQQIQLNIVALTRIAQASVTAFIARGRGTLINVSSVLALNPLAGSAIYSGTKAYVLQFSRVLQQEVAPHGITVQVVLPGAVDTDLWSSNGVNVSTLRAGSVMSVDELVDAALAGLDLGEPVTVPSLPAADWERFEAAQKALAPNLSRDRADARYKVAASQG